MNKWIIMTVFLSSLSFAADTLMVFAPSPTCQLFEIDDKGQWKEVNPGFVKDKSLVVTSNAVQPQHYYFVQQDRWFSSLKVCFKKPSFIAKKYPKQTIAEKIGIPKTVVEEPDQVVNAAAEKKAAAKALAAQRAAEKRAAKLALAEKKAAAKALAAQRAAEKREAAKTLIEQKALEKRAAKLLAEQKALEKKAASTAKAAEPKPNEPVMVEKRSTPPPMSIQREDLPSENQPTPRSSSPTKFKLYAIASAIWWTDFFKIASNNTKITTEILAKQAGGMAGVSLLSGNIAENLKYSGSLAFLYALSRTSSKSTTVIYNTNGITVYGGYLSGGIHYAFQNILVGLEPFLMYRAGEWITPAPNGGIVYSLEDKSAFRFGALFELRNYLNKVVYLAPKVGFYDEISNLTFVVQIGVGI